MNQTDLRVIKTEQQIENAFLDLLIAKPYRSITIQDILDNALINRSTFYRHYPSKDALAEKMVADFYLPYEEFLKARFNLPTNECLPQFIERITVFIESQKHKILPLWKIQTPTIHLYDDMYQLIKAQYIASAKAQGKSGNTDFQGHLYANMVLSILSELLEKGYAFDIKQIREEMMRMLATARMQDVR